MAQDSLKLLRKYLRMSSPRLFSTDDTGKSSPTKLLKALTKKSTPSKLKRSNRN